MRLIVTAQGKDLDAEIDPRFGRASSFLIVDTEEMTVASADNIQSLHLPQGAGIQTAQNVLRYNPKAVLTGNCGPKAFRVLEAAGVDVVVGLGGRIRDAIEGYMAGKYRPSAEPNVQGHWM